MGRGRLGWVKHTYGSAEDVPGLLRRCGGPDPDDADDASSELLNLLFHQGGWVCSAAPAALPFVLRLAATPQVPSRCAMLEDDRTWMAAARALAGIGPAGTGARDLLLARSRTPGPHTDVLTTTVHDLTEGTDQPVMVPALDHLARLGRAAHPAAHLLRDVPARDQRLRGDGGWRGFVQDEIIRTAVGELLSASGAPSPMPTIASGHTTSAVPCWGP